MSTYDINVAAFKNRTAQVDLSKYNASSVASTYNAAKGAEEQDKASNTISINAKKQEIPDYDTQIKNLSNESYKQEIQEQIAKIDKELEELNTTKQNIESQIKQADALLNKGVVKQDSTTSKSNSEPLLSSEELENMNSEIIKTAKPVLRSI